MGSNPLHHEISMHILHAVLCTFPKVHGEFVKQSRASLVGDHFLYSRNVNVYFMVILYGEIRN